MLRKQYAKKSWHRAHRGKAAKTRQQFLCLVGELLSGRFAGPLGSPAVLCCSLSPWPGLLWPGVDQTSRGESSPHLHHF